MRYGDLIDESVAPSKCNRATMGGVGTHCFLMPLVGQGAKQPSFPFSVHQANAPTYPARSSSMPLTSIVDADRPSAGRCRLPYPARPASKSPASMTLCSRMPCSRKKIPFPQRGRGRPSPSSTAYFSSKAVGYHLCRQKLARCSPVMQPFRRSKTVETGD